MTTTASMLVTIVLALTVSTGSASAKIHCHWTHFRKAGVNYYVQVCAVPKPKHHKHVKRHPVAPATGAVPTIG